MLTLQKASAGSGKTYALTRHFIHFLIGIKPEGAAAYRLRTDDEMLDGIRRILAITFTNKATNEMQMRIIDKLDDLANFNGGPDKPDYMDDFTKEFGVPSAIISEIAGKALKMLLNNYSDFNVSTIDSFFQLVLRTLAYECGVMDAYQVELESNYVSRMGLNAAIDAVDNPRDPDSREIRIWLQRIMDNEEGTSWNIFQKHESAYTNSSTPYQSLLADFQRIDNEDYRNFRAELEKYLENNTDLLNLYRELDEKHVKEKKRLYRTMTAEAQAVIDTATDPGQLAATRTDAGKPFGAARKVLQLRPLSFKSVTFLDPDKFWGKKSIEDKVARESEWAVRKEHYLKMQNRSLGIPEHEIIKIAVKSMGLDDLKPFNPEEKIIESMLGGHNKGLVDMTLTEFADETSSESPAPGGGSISAYMGALGAALGAMVANLSAHKAGWDDRWEEFSDQAVKGREIQEKLMHLVDEDTDAFNRIMAVFAMPKGTPEEKEARSAALQKATLYATEVPLRTMRESFRVFELVKAMALNGNPASVSDAGVGALAARAAVFGAWLNVKINAAGLKDREQADNLLNEAADIAGKAQKEEAEVLDIVNQKIS